MARSMPAQGNALGAQRKKSQALKGQPIDQGMPQSLAKIYLHLVFSTKNRAPMINDQVRDPLHGYMATVLKNLGCHANLINSVEDHIHLLFELGRTVAVSEVVEDVKKSSSKWIKSQPGGVRDFAWQNGYGVFSVSHSNVDTVRDYIVSQDEHHRKRTFQDELRALLEKHGVDYDERYVWD
jgi:REP-associated tyrosine transposase